YFAGAEERLARERKASRRMVSLFYQALQLCSEDEKNQGQVFAAFEWPRQAIPWSQPFPLFVALQKRLPYVCDFDGRRYELVDKDLRPLCKPWQVITAFAPLRQALGLRCPRDRKHADCRGEVATQSGRYSELLAKVITQAVLQIPEIRKSGNPETGTKEASSVPCVPVTVDDAEGEPVEAPVKSPPAAPTDEERQRHELTHTPAAPWCEFCIRGKSKDDPHRQRSADEQGVPLIELDYSFWRTEAAEDVIQVVLMGVRTDSGSGFAALCQAKGRADATVLRELQAWLGYFGLTGALQVRTDVEPAIGYVARQMASRRQARTVVETTPVNSSSSIGACDRRAQAVAAQVRTLRASLQSRYGITVKATDPVFGWTVRYGNYLLDRFQVHRRHGQTPYAHLYRKPFEQALFAFGSIVMGRDPGALDLGNAEDRWYKGVWLGRALTSTEHILSTANGIRLVRSLRLLPDADQSAEDFEQLAVWSVWKQQPSELDPDLPAQTALPGTTSTSSTSVPTSTSSTRVPNSTSSTSVPAITPSTSLGQGEPQSRPKRFLRNFKADMGHTTGCQACEAGGLGTRQTVSGKARQEAYRQRLATPEIPDESQLVRVTSVPPLSLPMPEHDEGMPQAPAKRGMPEENVEPPRRVRMRVKGPAVKRPAEPTPQDDEEEARVRIRDDVVGFPDDTAGYTDSLQAFEEEYRETAARDQLQLCYASRRTWNFSSETHRATQSDGRNYPTSKSSKGDGKR
ncbi:unnamed protein product, partial [Polarella glacialis]